MRNGIINGSIEPNQLYLIRCSSGAIEYAGAEYSDGATFIGVSGYPSWIPLTAVDLFVFMENDYHSFGLDIDVGEGRFPEKTEICCIGADIDFAEGRFSEVTKNLTFAAENAGEVTYFENYSYDFVTEKEFCSPIGGEFVVFDGADNSALISQTMKDLLALPEIKYNFTYNEFFSINDVRFGFLPHTDGSIKTIFYLKENLIDFLWKATI